MKLIYSPDDNGWYWERYSDWKTSQLFPTRQVAKDAKRNNQLNWEDTTTRRSRQDA